jgi:hypothetical protein
MLVGKHISQNAQLHYTEVIDDKHTGMVSQRIYSNEDRSRAQLFSFM